MSEKIVIKYLLMKGCCRFITNISLLANMEFDNSIID